MRYFILWDLINWLEINALREPPPREFLYADNGFHDRLLQPLFTEKCQWTYANFWYSSEMHFPSFPEEILEFQLWFSDLDRNLDSSFFIVGQKPDPFSYSSTECLIFSLALQFSKISHPSFLPYVCVIINSTHADIHTSKKLYRPPYRPKP